MESEELLVYRIAAEAFDRVSAEPLSGEVAKGTIAAAALLEDAGSPLLLRLELGDDARQNLVRDAVATEVSADQRVARVPPGELLGAVMCKSIVGDETGGGEIVERSGALVLRNPGALEPLVELPAGAVAVPKRSERQLRGVGQ